MVNEIFIFARKVDLGSLVFVFCLQRAKLPLMGLGLSDVNS